jgi:hypothetical protein
LFDEAAQIARWWKFGSSVDQYRDIGGMRDAHDFREIRARVGTRKIQNAGRAIANRTLDLPRFGVAHTAGSRAIRKSNLDQSRSGSAYGMIV